MGKGGVTKFQLAQRLKKVSDMYLQGIEVPEIAKKVGVSESQVYKDLAKQKKEWQEAIELNTNYVMAQMLAETDVLKFTYWQAWRRSQEDAKTTRLKVSQKAGKATAGKTAKTDLKAAEQLKADDKDKKQDSSGDVTQSVDKSEEIKGKEGNPAFLRGVEWCLNFQAEMLGLKKFNFGLTGDVEIEIEA